MPVFQMGTRRARPGRVRCPFRRDQRAMPAEGDKMRYGIERMTRDRLPRPVLLSVSIGCFVVAVLIAIVAGVV